MAKLRFIESQHPQQLSYVSCESTPHFYLVQDVEEPEETQKRTGIDLDKAAGMVMFGICAVYAACFTGALLAMM